MGDRLGTYVAPAATRILELQMIEGCQLFVMALLDLHQSFPGIYVLLNMSTFNSSTEETHLGEAQMNSPTG